MGKTYIQLGRTGDILAVLPLLYHAHTQGDRCSLMVSRDYSDLLDGVSYLNPIVHNGPMWDLDRAMTEAKKVNGEVVCTQINGPRDAVREHAFKGNKQEGITTDSFLKESWKLAGKLPLWKEQPPLVFDRRNTERERKLINDIITPGPKKKKVLLVALSGNTAPFPYTELLLDLLRLKLSGWRMIDISEVKAERFYDLLGLYEVASALLASDSAPLHLAHAVPTLPMLALINDKPHYWHGSPWRPQHVFHCRYGDFAKRALEIFDVLKTLGGPGCALYSYNNTTHIAPRLFHVWNRCEEVKENAGARELAQNSWTEAYADKQWIPFPLQPGSVGKDSFTLGDPEHHPMLRAALQLPLMVAKPNDILVLTRSTTCFRQELPGQILSNLPCYAHRIINGSHHPAVDLFAAPKTFWESIWKDIPELVMGRDRLWATLLMHIFRLHGAKEIRDAVYSLRESPPSRIIPHTVPRRLKHNTDTLEKFIAERGIRDSIPAVSKQAELLPLNLSGLPAYAYNPTVCRVKDKLWLIYRYHQLGSIATQLGIAELEPHGNATRTARLPVPGHSVEDPKFFEFRKQRWLSWIESDYSGQVTPHAVVKIGRLSDDWKIAETIQPEYGKNDWSAIEKNWNFVGIGDALWCLYQSSPEQWMIRFDDSGKPLEEYKAEGPTWPYGPIKGGFMLGTKGEHLLRIFHSTLDNEDKPWRRRYYIGALLMEKKPPFKVVSVSKAPLLIGSAEDDLSDFQKKTIAHYKGRVVFPGGAVKLTDGYLFAVGVNDSACALVKIKDLKL